MSKTTQETKEIFETYKQNVARYFNEIEKASPQYMQSITNLQQEYTAAWKSLIDSAISLQQELAAKIGINTNAPATTIKIINDSTDEIIKMKGIQNKAILAVLDTFYQNLKTFNDNAKVLARLNENIFQSWMAAWTPRSQ